jgi:hypothetical protein
VVDANRQSRHSEALILQDSQITNEERRRARPCRQGLSWKRRAISSLKYLLFWGEYGQGRWLNSANVCASESYVRCSGHGAFHELIECDNIERRHPVNLMQLIEIDDQDY